jgi:hypothetical protein
MLSNGHGELSHGTRKSVSIFLRFVLSLSLSLSLSDIRFVSVVISLIIFLFRPLYTFACFRAWLFMLLRWECTCEHVQCVSCSAVFESCLGCAELILSGFPQFFLAPNFVAVPENCPRKLLQHSFVIYNFSTISLWTQGHILAIYIAS